MFQGLVPVPTEETGRQHLTLEVTTLPTWITTLPTWIVVRVQMGLPIRLQLRLTHPGVKINLGRRESLPYPTTTAKETTSYFPTQPGRRATLGLRDQPFPGLPTHLGGLRQASREMLRTIHRAVPHVKEEQVLQEMHAMVERYGPVPDS